jgi:RNA polymerase sigma factor (sigma-70 family)
MNSMPAIDLKEARTAPRSLRAKKAKKAKVINLLARKEALRGGLSAQEREDLVIEFRLKARTLAHSILRKWHSRLDPQEVESIVDLSLCEAVRRFNKHKGASFMTFLFYHLRGNLIRAVATAASLNFVPLGDHENSEYGEGRNINAIEIADTLCNHDFMAPDEVLLKKEIAGLSQKACERLDPLEREVIFRIYVQEQQLMDVARTLGYSRCHISRVKKKALETLFAELAPTMAAHGSIAKPSFDEDGESEKQERRVIHRRRPRSRVAAEKRSMRIEMGELHAVHG